MKVIRLKNIVIWALVIVNAFFLVFFLGRIIREHSEKKETLENLSELFDRNGIYLDTGNFREGGELTGLIISRDILEEQRLAEKLLGQTEMTENGGIYTYTGTENKGQAVFRSGGVFDITFSAHVYDDITGALNTAKGVLQTMDIKTAALEMTGEKGNETVQAVCAWERQPIFNCRIRFFYQDGSLVKISGTYAASIEATANKSDMSSCATALTRFLNEVKNDRISCERIAGVAPGYKLKAAGDGISAVWRVEIISGTKSVVYFIDAENGNIEPDAL